MVKLGRIFFVVGLMLASVNVCFAQGAQTIEDAFRNGSISGEIGSYFEFTNSDADAADFGWASAYLTLKYETLSFKNVKLGARFWAIGELYADHENSTTNPFETDVEKEFTLPELYVNVSFFENSSVTLGRFNHKKGTHLDDAQSEGFYVDIKEIDNVDIIFGVMNRFAEIDYDDSEDFGRTNDAQDLDNETTFGSDSKPFVVFLEEESKLTDWFKVNPFLYYQSGHAGVYGVAANVDLEQEDLEVKYGTKVTYYHVAAEISGSKNSDVFSIFPYIKKGPVSLTVGYAKFKSGSALNRPVWFSDYMTILDQQKEYGRAGSQKVSAKLKYSKDKLWAHYAFGNNNYDYTSSKGDRSVEHELQVGYKFTKSLDANIRVFDVQYDEVDDLDYNKIETRLRFKF